MGILKKIKLRIKKWHPLYGDIERINKRLDTILEIIDPDRFHTSGERQVSPSLNRIRPDHLGRYEFALRYVKDQDKLLDIACGIGYGSYIIASQSPGANIIGVDISDKAVDYANQFYKIPNNSFMVGDCHNVEFPPKSFDGVISFETIEHIEHPESFLKRLHSFLKPGGFLISSTPNQERLHFNKKDFPHHLRHYTKNEFEELLNAAGFIIESRHSQHERKRKDVREDSSGLYHIFVSRKP